MSFSVTASANRNDLRPCDRIMIMDKEELRQQVALFMARCYARGLTTATGGNISVRCGEIMLITPSGKDKASLSPEDIAEVRIADGKNLTPDKKLSIESGMHRLIYLRRSEAGAVVHCHPLFASLFSASEEAIDTSLIAESWFLLDNVEKVSYALMGTERLAEEVSRSAMHANALLLENHGALAIGKDLLSAFDRMECLEQAAKLTYLSKAVRVRGLNSEERAEIACMR